MPDTRYVVPVCCFGRGSTHCSRHVPFYQHLTYAWQDDPPPMEGARSISPAKYFTIEEHLCLRTKYAAFVHTACMGRGLAELRGTCNCRARCPASRTALIHRVASDHSNPAYFPRRLISIFFYKHESYVEANRPVCPVGVTDVLKGEVRRTSTTLGAKH